MTNYEKIKALAKKLKSNIPDMLALSRNNDPFFAGSDASTGKARWFAEIWERLGYSKGVHLRRVHYQLVSSENAKKLNGQQYENTEADWGVLCDAGKHARYLGLVDPGAFVDRRNPDPKIYIEYEGRISPYAEPCFYDWDMPTIDADVGYNLDWDLPWLRLHGYEYSDMLQPYHTEIWIEKSTMNDILKPLCRDYSVNFITGLGFMSITAVDMLINRIIDIGKPCRIMYISDFDPAGDGMPVAVSRQLEYWLGEKGVDGDVRLQPIMLTKEQVIEFDLPRVPLKDSDLRKANFEERHGEGAVELDALEALHPGEFKRIVEDHILQFRDLTYGRRLVTSRREAQKIIDAAIEETIQPHQDSLDELKHEVQKVVDKYQGIIEDLKEQMDNDLGPYENELFSIRQAVQKELDSLTVYLPPLPPPETSPQDDGWLFDSRRDYFEQLEYYRAKRQEKPIL